MIPLSLITGFLGSGKTTLLGNIVAGNRDRRLACVVNECGSVDVDGFLLDIPDERIVRIPGGSIFCRCLSGEFIRHLRAIREYRDSQGLAVEGVIIEASGIADPRVIAQMLKETRLDEAFQLRTIVAVVEPGSFLKLIDTLPNIVAQVEACDLAIINKTDLYGETEIHNTEEEIGRRNPAAAIVRSRYCRVEVDPFIASGRQWLEGQYARCADPNYATRTVSLEMPIDVERLAAELRSIQDRIYRVKGFVPGVEGLVHVDLSPGGLSTRPVGGDHTAVPCSLVFVHSPRGRQCTEDLIAKLDSGALSVQPPA